MPKTRVSSILESFTQSLSSLVREKVSEAVSKATTEFFETRVGEKVKEVKKVVRHRRRKIEKRLFSLPSG